MDGGFRRLNRERIHHLHGSRNDARADDRRHRLATGVDAVERGQQRLDALGLSEDPDDNFRGNPERAFRPDEQAEQIGTRGIDHRAADVGDLTVRQNDFDREHMVDGEAVLETVGAAGVLGDVTADGAHLLARRIGRVVVAVRRDSLRDLEVRHARLDGHATVRDIDLEHAIEARERDHDAILGRQRAARQPCPVAARDKRDAGTMADAHHGLHLGGRRWQDHGRRQASQVRQGIALIGQQLQRLVQNRVGSADAGELVQESLVHRVCLSYMLSASFRTHGTSPSPCDTSTRSNRASCVRDCG